MGDEGPTTKLRYGEKIQRSPSRAEGAESNKENTPLHWEVRKPKRNPSRKKRDAERRKVLRPGYNSFKPYEAKVRKFVEMGRRLQAGEITKGREWSGRDERKKVKEFRGETRGPDQLIKD